MPCCPESVLCQSAFLGRVHCDIQLHTECGAEDSEQHGGVAAEDRAAGHGQWCSAEGCAQRRTCL